MKAEDRLAFGEVRTINAAKKLGTRLEGWAWPKGFWSAHFFQRIGADFAAKSLCGKKLVMNPEWRDDLAGGAKCNKCLAELAKRREKPC